MEYHASQQMSRLKMLRSQETEGGVQIARVFSMVVTRSCKVACCKLQVASRWLQVAGYWLLVAGHFSTLNDDL